MRLLRLVVPAVAVGVASSLVLLVVSLAADGLEHVLWHSLPGALGVAGSGRWWPMAILTLTGLAVGLVVWRVPTGPDPATESLVGEPLPIRVLPGMLLATGLCLAGGVSLGPENPITAANVALAVALGVRMVPSIPAPLWTSLAAAGTIGALFGTPVAAALILSELAVGAAGQPLWDRLFAPLVAAGAGAVTTVLVAEPSFSAQVGDYTGPRPMDLVSGAAVATAGALLGLAGVYAFPYLHRAFHRLPGAVVRLTAGGIVLGLLGAIGGQITLFKGVDQIKELTGDPAAYGAGALLGIVLIKLLALLVSATCGFIGGRIFPAVFLGVALGMLTHALVPAVPTALAIASGVLGVLLAVTQQGWLSLFTAATIAPDLDLLPILCLVMLPAWLLVSGRPQMVIEDNRSNEPQRDP